MNMWLAKFRGVIVGVAAMIGVITLASPAFAVKQFYAELEAKYVKRNSPKPSDIRLVAAFEQAHCMICHPGDDKHRLTEYGGQVATRINKYDKQNKKKIQAALDEVATLHSNPYNPKSPTYGELFHQGKLPPSLGH